jgi:hypothetical protein
MELSQEIDSRIAEAQLGDFGPPAPPAGAQGG